MPYYGSGIGQRNYNVLRQNAFDLQNQERNALMTQRLKREVNDADRKRLMQNLWIGGQLLNSARDEDSYQKVKQESLRLGGENAVAGWPDQFDPEFVRRKQAENNILFQALGMGRPQEVTLYRIDENGNRIETKVTYGSTRYNEMIRGERGYKWQQGHLVPPQRRSADEEVDIFTRKQQALKDTWGPTGGKGGQGTEDERNARAMGMTPVQYKLWYQEELIKLRRKYGQLSDMEQRQAINISTQINALQREISKEESMMTMPGAKEGFPERVKRLGNLKDQLQAYQDEYDRIVGKPRGAGDFGKRPPDFPKDAWDSYIKNGKDPDDLINRWNQLKNKPTIGR